MASIVGAACILRYREVWLFELQKQHKWRQGTDGALVIGAGCIGGGLERNESPQQALQREALEEIGCRVKLGMPCSRVLVGPDFSVKELATGEGDPLAVLYWEAAGPGFIPGARVAVYLGVSVGEPKPVDLPAVLCVPAPAVPMLWAGGTVREIIRKGGLLLEKIPIPRDAHLEPVGTVAILGQLHQAAPELVEGLFDRG